MAGMGDERRRALKQAMDWADTAVQRSRPKPTTTTSTLPPPSFETRGLESKGFSPAEVRGVHRMADGGTARTDLAAQRKAAEEKQRSRRSFGVGYGD